MPTKKITTAPPIKDVTHPDDTASSTTAKPIIVTNRPMIKDPMVVEGKNDGEESSSIEVKTKPTKLEPIAEAKSLDEALAASKEKVIPIVKDEKPDKAKEPTSEDKKPAEAKAETPPKKNEELPKEAEKPKPPAAEDKPEDKASKPAEDAKSAEPPASDDKPKEAKTEKQPAEEEADKTEDETHPDKTPATVTASDGLTTKEDEDAKKADEAADGKEPSVDEKEAEEEAKRAEHEAAIQKLTESRHYTLPIVTSEQRHNRKAVLVGIILILVMAIAWADIALDAGLITIHGVKPVTHFFSK